MTAQALDPLQLPLWGSRLIEASAGTGKTWTIAALVLRLVLGHGGSNGFHRPLAPAEILVMTFTRAATRELSDRIRARLLQAAQVFRGEAPPPAGDALLATLLADHPEGPPRSAAAWRLALAAEGMDDAAVHTIDAWCQRMLREHAFDSGCLFDEELNANEQQMQDQAARDYWRQQLYPLGGAAWDLALGVWPRVEALALDARRLLGQPLLAESDEACDDEPLAALIQRLAEQRGQALAVLKAGWPRRAAAMQAWLDEQTTLKACPFDKRKLAVRHYTGWLKALTDWANDPQSERPDLKTGAQRLTPTGLAEALKPDTRPPEIPPEFQALADLLQALEDLPPLAPALRLHAARHIAQRLAALKAQAGRFGFADLLQRLDTALDPSRNGPAAARLRERIRAQYPVALIDEFQDTSALQSRLFDRLYGIAANDRDTALLLIGDPKQSIYGFRGADIRSYLQVRQATTGRHHRLGTNHRSTQALVAAVNRVFEQAEARDGAGAFLYRPEGADADHNPLPFEAVQARGRAESFVSAGAGVPALQLVLDAHLQDGRSHQRAFAERCAEQIVVWLNDVRTGFQDPNADLTRLRPADIAVLVRSGREAAAVRLALRRRGVASVYLSDQDSVFRSPEAADLLRWLAAVASPLDTRLARAALATPLVGLPLDELLHLAQDDEAFDARSEQLRQLQAVWQSQGVLTLLRQSLHRLGLPARWLSPDGAAGTAQGAAAGGERRLTNVLHLAELLQAASEQLDGEQALIRWLAGQIDDASAGHSAADEQIVRLESDADLVQVVTVHKSKGLEYPVVMLPFATHFRPERAGQGFVAWVDEAGQPQLDLQPGRERLQAADHERLREDLRLLYVALTRARHALWVGLAALKLGQAATCQWHRSAIGQLISGPAPVAQADLPELLATLARPCPAIALLRATPRPELPTTPLAARGPLPALRLQPAYEAAFDRRWGIASFSMLVRALPAAGLWQSSTAAVRDDEGQPPGGAVQAAPEPVAALVADPVPAVAAPWHSFPRGALAGNFLHDQLQWLAEEGFALVDDAPAGTHAGVQAEPAWTLALQRRCERAGWGHRAPQVQQWLQQLLATPLPPVGASLAGVARHGRLIPEMEFWFPSAGLDATQVDALCQQHLLPGLPRPPLPERALQGLLMGFADLVFEHQGRFWVLDYKSNHLGPQDADYHAAALQASMAQHRYDVQAALYLLALHRLLRSRLGAAYQPAQHLGGALYFFLRGLKGPERGCCWLQPPLALLDGLDALFGGDQTQAAA